jgi:hypothetical protein
MQQMKEEFATIMEKTIQAEAGKIQNETVKQDFQEVMDASLAAVDRMVKSGSPPKASPEDNDDYKSSSSAPNRFFEKALARQDAQDAKDAEQELAEIEADEEEDNGLDRLAPGNDEPPTPHRATNIGMPPRPEDPVPVDGRTVQVMFCYSKYEVMEGASFDDNVGQFHCPLDYQAIKKEALEFYGEDDNTEYFRLEYYHNKRWHLLDDTCFDVLKYYHEIQTLHKDEFQTLLFIRLPFMFDTSDYPEAEGQGEGENSFLKMAEMYMGKKGDKPKPPATLADKIAQYLKELQAEHWKRSPNSPDPLDPHADIMQFKLVVPERQLAEEYEIYDAPEPVTASTRHYLLDRARADYDLRDLLLMYVGALDHMVRVLHYDLSWPEERKAREAEEDENEEEDEGDTEEDDEDDGDVEEEDDDESHASDHHREHNHEHSAECKH